jgi:hypothetical protein
MREQYLHEVIATGNAILAHMDCDAATGPQGAAPNAKRGRIAQKMKGSSSRSPSAVGACVLFEKNR